MSKNTLLSELINYVSANSSGNVTVAAPTSGLALDVNGTGRFTGQLTLGSTITNGTFTYTLPSATGTLALTSQIPSVTGFVPYSGATSVLNLGIYSMFNSGTYITKSGTSSNAIYFEHAVGSSIASSGYSAIGVTGTDGITMSYNGSANTITFRNNLLSAARTYSLPDASGTIALTNNLSAYLPLSGGTLTGALNGTSASFSGNGFFGGATTFAGLNGGISVNGSSSSGINFRTGDTLRGYIYTASSNIYLESVSGSVIIAPNGNPALTLASTGAATFSSSIAATSATFSDLVSTTSVYRIVQASVARGGLYTYNQVAGTGTDYSIGLYSEGEAFIVTGGTTTKRLTISSTGAATFSTNVGIGGPSLGDILHIMRNGTTSYAAMRVTNTSSTADVYFGIGGSAVGNVDLRNNAYVMNSGASSLAFGTNDTVKMTILSGGNVGIGTTSPGYKLEVNATNSVLKLLSTGATFGSPGINLLQGAIDTIVTATNNGLEIGTWSSHPIIFRVSSTGSTEAMRITSGGNVGIGTTTPGVKLTVFGGSIQNAIVGTTSSHIQLANSLGSTYFGNDANGGYVYTDWNSPFLFYTNITEKMRITSGGQVLIASTSSTWASTNRAVLEVGGPSSTNALIGLKMGTIPGGYIFHNGTDMYIEQNQAFRLYCIAAANGVYLTAGATSWTANSDERLKTINYSIDNAVEKLMSLRAVNFSWKSDSSNKENLGLIAQDVEKVFPQVIDKGALPNTPSNPITDTTEYLGVRYQELVPVLVKAIQEQQVQINELKQLINK